MLRPLAVVLAVASTLAFSTPVRADAPDRAPGTKVTGHWQGMVKDDTGADSPYQVQVHIKRPPGAAALRGKVTYPFCSGYWSFVKTQDGWTVFTEHITRDPGLRTCVPKLKVKVKRTAAGGLVVRWVFHSRTDHMLAHRV
jgi:hypothetical protein